MYLAHAAKVARCIQHDANHEPCPLEDRLEAGTGPHVVADPSRNLHWVRPRPVVVNRDYLELPSPKLHRWRTYIKSPVTLAIYAPANAAAGAGLLVGPPLVAGLPPAPPGWAVVLLLHGCAWSKPKVPVNRKKKLFAEKLLLGRAGLAAALAPLRTGAGQAAARWWFVTGRWVSDIAPAASSLRCTVTHTASGRTCAEVGTASRCLRDQQEWLELLTTWLHLLPCCAFFLLPSTRARAMPLECWPCMCCPAA